jgi:hypothetical protein
VPMLPDPMIATLVLPVLLIFGPSAWSESP